MEGAIIIFEKSKITGKIIPKMEKTEYFHVIIISAHINMI